jgi:hypothetical protein
MLNSGKRNDHEGISLCDKIEKNARNVSIDAAITAVQDLRRWLDRAKSRNQTFGQEPVLVSAGRSRAGAVFPAWREGPLRCGLALDSLPHQRRIGGTKAPAARRLDTSYGRLPRRHRLIGPSHRKQMSADPGVGDFATRWREARGGDGWTLIRLAPTTSDTRRVVHGQPR